ncbi:MAG: hypothetical protein ACK5MV_00090 [Aminipila sp.]
MVCDKCIKATVCKLKEDCNRLERSVNGNSINDVFSVDVKCKEYKDNMPSRGYGQPVRSGIPKELPRTPTGIGVVWTNELTEPEEKALNSLAGICSIAKGE